MPADVIVIFANTPVVGIIGALGLANLLFYALMIRLLFLFFILIVF